MSSSDFQRLNCVFTQNQQNSIDLITAAIVSLALNLNEFISK